MPGRVVLAPCTSVSAHCCSSSSSSCWSSSSSSDCSRPPPPVRISAPADTGPHLWTGRRPVGGCSARPRSPSEEPPQCNPRTSPPAPGAGAPSIGRPPSSAGSPSSSPPPCWAAWSASGRSPRRTTATATRATADQAIADAGFADDADEQVLVQGKGDVKVGDKAFTAAVGDTVDRLTAVKTVTEVESPLAEGQRGPAVQGRPLGVDHLQDPRRRRPGHRPRRRVAGRRRRRPGGEPGRARRAVRRRQRRQGPLGGLRRGLPAGRDLLPADHPDHPDRRLRRSSRRGHPAAVGR